MKYLTLGNMERKYLKYIYKFIFLQINCQVGLWRNKRGKKRMPGSQKEDRGEENNNVFFFWSARCLFTICIFLKYFIKTVMY